MATLLKEEKATSPDKGVVVAQHAHVEDKYNDVLDMDKSGLAEGHEVLEKELTLWQNLKLYRRVRCLTVFPILFCCFARLWLLPLNLTRRFYGR